jgi:hypothetical protein
VGSGGLSMGSLIDDEDDEADAEGADTQCAYVGESGVRCRNHARPGSRFCGVHQGAAAGGADAAGEAGGAADAVGEADDAADAVVDAAAAADGDEDSLI